ncbi:pseudouridine-5'-phosphate glycosidase, partial [Escherichia coli]|uniref:pseudouridine-5'-phosphate glycosidase n=1 Tax=Escherichia coli TaxID=562 RepID=UPI003F818573
MSELKISPELLQISPEVQDALKNKKPVVALESTIISHGMPGNDSNLLIVFYVQIMPDDFVMQLHR